MNNDYQHVTDALKRGVSAEYLCMTCPWDRHCVSPPEMTAQDIEDRMHEAEEVDSRRMQRNPGALPMVSLVGMMIFAGRDTAAEACPVFTLRLRSSDGRRMADDVKKQMQGWKHDD